METKSCIVTDMNTVLELEKIRCKAFKINYEDLNLNETFFSHNIKNKKIIPFASFIDGKPVSGCYVSSDQNSLYIESIFTDPAYRGSDLKLGRNLLQFVLDNKELVEKEFNRQLYMSKLCYLNDKVKELYKELGYRDLNSIMGTMCKHL